MKEIYLLTRLCALQNALEIVCSICIFAVIAGGMAYLMFVTSDDGEESKVAVRIKDASRKVLIFSLAMWLLYMVVPSRKDMLFIIGVGGIYDYIQDNDKAQEIPDKAIKAINQWLQEDKE